MKKIIISLCTIFVFLGFYSSYVFADTYISGQIDTDEVWQKSNGPYYLEDVLIMPSATVSIQEGTQIFVDGYIAVMGRLNSLGSPTNKVRFDLNPDYFSWDMYIGEGGSVSLDNTNISSISGITSSTGSLTMKHSSLINPLSGIIGTNGSYIDLDDVHIGGLEEGSDLSLVSESYARISQSVFEDSMLGDSYIIAGYGNSTIDIADSEIIPFQSTSLIMVGGNLNASHMTTSGGLADGIDLVRDTGRNTPVTATITKSDIKGFEGNAIFGLDANISITQSKMEDNNLGVEIISQRGTSVDIKKSSFISNTMGVFFVNQNTQSPVNFDVTENWWGDPTGPLVSGKNNTGTGDSIVAYNGNLDYIQFSPWLLSSPDTACCSSVMFLPGVKASRLYTKGILENQLWEPNRNADVEKIYLDANGKSINQNIYTRDIIERTNIGGGIFDQDVYKKFVESMDGLVADHIINEWESFPYDWRFDYKDIINDGVKRENEIINIITEIERLALNSKSGKVTIVAHSNGGLFAKVLITKLTELHKENLIDNLIMVAVPQLGTPEAILGLLHGDNQQISFVADKSVMKKLGENMKSAYNLLPSSLYFDDANGPVVSFDVSVDAVSNLRTKYGDTITSYSGLVDFLSGAKDGRPKPSQTDLIHPNILSTNLLSNAGAVHSSVDTWTPPSSIKIFEIAGWGIGTTNTVAYTSRAFCLPGTTTCITGLDHEAQKTNDGDGTVISSSALGGSGEKYYANIRDYNRGKTNINHGTILEMNEINDLVVHIIENKNTDLPQFVTREKPLSTGDARVRIAMHSPVSVDAYDTEGRHTGLASLPGSDMLFVENNIPNSLYEEVGEGKYIYGDESSLSNIVLEGLDSGTFSLDIRKTVGDASTTEVSFVDIPTNPNMEGALVLTATSTSLVLDVEGDGKADVTLDPTTPLDPVTYLTIIRKTIDGFDMSSKLKKEYIKKIDDIIKLVQKGNIKNAVKKIKDFNKKLQSIGRHKEERHHHKKIDKTDVTAFVAMLDELIALLQSK